MNQIAAPLRSVAVPDELLRTTLTTVSSLVTSEYPKLPDLIHLIEDAPSVELALCMQHESSGSTQHVPMTIRWIRFKDRRGSSCY